MDFVLTVIMVIFIGMLLAAAFTFGFTLLMIIIAPAGVMTLLTVGRELYRRWRFVRSATNWQEKPPPMIEGEFTDISEDK